MIIIFMVFGVALVQAGLSTESYKGQYCTDPRTMRKHAAYTEWADAYSCTRHRCQPGGRNLAIYTVGCKRVEAPESAIECEEVVEDTNMQFPFCCTRLRCLVVVRGEVWTRVLGQPWETLPAAPWSHMYKMKKPPPENSDFLPKGPEKGPVYELVDPEAEKVLRAADVTTVQPSLVAQPPDIVIALGTNTDLKLQQDIDRQSRMRKSFAGGPFVEDEKNQFQPPDDPENNQFTTEKSQVDNSGEERYFESGTDENTQNQKPAPQTWTDIPSQQWFLKTDGNDADNNKQETNHQSEGLGDKAEPKSVKLQQLVNAIGTRMRDIESVVQRMSEKVHEGKPEDGGSSEKGQTNFNDMELGQPPSPNEQEEKVKKPNSDGDYKSRFTEKKHTKYLHTAELTTDIPLYLEDSNLQGYFSDASNSVLRRANKGSPQTYMAPVDTRRKNTKIIEASDTERKHKKHHKKKKAKHMHKKHHKPEARKKFNIITSTEEKAMPRSLEDSDSAVRK